MDSLPVPPGRKCPPSANVLNSWLHVRSIPSDAALESFPIVQEA